ncbi:LacI family DNA-binding transcriptional regulator [Frondihabitans cladoniiphilus]|uniref:LacI family DNA-binding transcriptional regulator n=1 Tax=Frondihabitans cladoniiphilus TaxID=715785 RepID=A0ABP8WB97_9MICO
MAKTRLQDVADVAGVSMKTVSNVVRGYEHVSEKTRLRVQQAIDDLAYRPNASGRSLATGRSGMLALVFSDVSIPYYSELAHLISELASDRGYRLLLEQTSGTLEGERAVVSAAEGGLVDGVIFQPSLLSSAEIAQHRGDVPFVLLGEGPAPLSVDHVMIDNIAAAAAATSHLARLGRRRIAFLGHELGSQTQTSKVRLIGYQNGLEQAGLPLDLSLLIASRSVNAGESAQAVREALDHGLEFDAIVCRDDLAAFGALRALQERGLRVPEDVAVTGWDDVAMAALVHPSLSSIRPDTRTLATWALDMLEERIDGYDGIGRHRVADFELVLRESAPAVS